MGRMTIKDLYNAISQSTTAIESISWTRFYNFLMGNSILILAWATIYTSSTDPPWKKLVMCIICFIGIISGFAFGDLGRRTRDYINCLVNQLENIEKDSSVWSEGITNEMKPNIQIAILREIEKKKNHWWSSNPFILTWMPRSFSFLYAVMLIASIIYSPAP